MPAITDKKYKLTTSQPWGIVDYGAEVYRYRHLIRVFAAQELRTQYTQTRLNALWIVLRPLLVLALFTFIFDNLIKIPGLRYPYYLFAFTGLLVWNNFSFLVNNGGSAIINSQNLIRKIYFPRIILIISKMLVSMVEIAVSLVLILIVMLLMAYPVTIHLFLLPLFLSISVMAGLTVAIWLCAFSIRYRDLLQFAPTIIGFLIWLTPVFYPVSIVPERYAFLLYLNPVAAAIQGCRWAILGDSLPSVYYLPSIALCFVLFIVGIVMFVRAESDLADHI